MQSEVNMPRELKYVKVERRREIVTQELENLETQLWARERDRAKWEGMDPESLKARAIDGRVVEQARQQRQQELARASYDIELLEIALANAEAEMDRIGPKAETTGGNS